MTTREKILSLLLIGPLCLAALMVERPSRAAGLCDVDSINGPPTATDRFILDSGQSKFIAHALRGGLLWFKGHEHFVAAREFMGEAHITPDTITPASLQLAVKTDSMVETS
ncbi:MAG TPA: hypothetical protein VMZ30_19325, partial [Pyrinomonadaceae bacterium]|nr:hypothetical protein [Pyrinomonadaceae bacterium]